MNFEWIPFLKSWTSSSPKSLELNNLEKRCSSQTAYVCQEISTKIPQTLARLTHSVSYQGCMYIFGGAQNFSKMFNDVHEYNPRANQWTQLQTSGSRPTKRSYASVVVYKDSLIVFGGYDINDQIRDDIYLMDFKSKHWHEVQVYPGGYIPKARYQHSAVIYKDEMIVFGGSCMYEWVNDVNKFTFKTYTWTKVECSGKIPSPRACHSAVVYENDMFVFGGAKNDGEELYGGQLYVLDLNCFKWKQIESVGQPQIVWGHSAEVYDKYMFIVCGSFGKRNYSNAVYRFNLNTYKWKKIKCNNELLKPRNYHCSAVINHEMYIFGGIIKDGEQCSEFFKMRLDVEKPITLNRKAFIDIIINFTF
jgi:N-acetylneuraminic acid mutarotase